MRQHPFEAKPKRRCIALQGLLDQLARNCLCFTVKQCFRCDRRTFLISWSDAKARSTQLSQHSRADSTRRSFRRIKISRATCRSRSFKLTAIEINGRLSVTLPTRLLNCRRARDSSSVKSNLNGMLPLLIRGRISLFAVLRLPA